MIVTTSGRRQGRTMVNDLIAEIEATELHRLLADKGYHLQPFRAPRELTGGNLRLRLAWKKTDGAETRIVRLTHTVTVPDRV